MTRVSACFLLCILFSACCSVQAMFNKDHLRLVDHNPQTNNFVFRGGSLKSLFGTMAWMSLNHYMKELAEKHGLKLPEKYQVIDLCLLTHETSTIEMEKKYFEKYPSRGTFKWWPMWGLNETTLNQACLLSANGNDCPVNPSLQPEVYNSSVVTAIASRYGVNGLEKADELLSRISDINTVLNTRSSVPTVQYFHCSCGCDRTGEVGAAYNMKFKRWNFTRAMKYDVSIPHRNIGYGHQVMAQWYCENMVATHTYVQAHNDCGNCKPFRCSH